MLTISCSTPSIPQLPSDLQKLLEEKDGAIETLKQQVKELQSNNLNGESSSETVSNRELEISKREIDGSIAEWLPENEDQIIDAILAEFNFPIPKSIISNAVDTAIHTELNTTIESIKFDGGDNRYSTETILVIPFSYDIPLAGQKSYSVQIKIDFILESTKVVSANIDTSSIEIEEVTRNTNPSITMMIIPLERLGDTYKYRTALKEESGVDVHFTALVREFIETEYVWTGGRDYFIDHVGGFTIQANKKLEWETSFDLSEVTTYFKEHGEITYRESWYGMDAEGHTIGISYLISTSEFK